MAAVPIARFETTLQFGAQEWLAWATATTISLPKGTMKQLYFQTFSSSTSFSGGARIPKFVQIFVAKAPYSGPPPDDPADAKVDEAASIVTELLETHMATSRPQDAHQQ
eukprot:CAMPEP_0172733638 /NCGR_PEP_ID=MMETSP1074-20121228/107644_1 /TAXON_ID=2916 /ORGANISM="Ceratium fusus, Strain PA161109" /LENGTH=108 /DNA_ID=CAMNT_0013562241 /DNA_START=185 /DNA_END=512 /DNA_ORIENTATION=-